MPSRKGQTPSTEQPILHGYNTRSAKRQKVEEPVQAGLAELPLAAASQLVVTWFLSILKLSLDLLKAMMWSLRGVLLIPMQLINWAARYSTGCEFRKIKTT